MDSGSAAFFSAYAVATTAGLLTTGLLAPLVVSAVREIRTLHQQAIDAEEEDAGMCELIHAASGELSMHQSMFEDEMEELWLCPGFTLADARCKEVYHDGEITVACAF